MSKATFSRLFVSATAVLCFAVASAKADFEISVESKMVDPGVDLLLLEIGIESDNPPENMSDFELILEINPLTATGGSSLQFVNPQSEDFLDENDYIFANTSESKADGLSTVTIDSATEITFIDVSVNASGDFLDVPVTSGHILAWLELSHELGSASPDAVSNDEYSIDVSLLSNFLNADGDEVDFTSTSGVVTFNPVAIPEPSFAGVMMIASCGVMMKRRRRRKV